MKELKPELNFNLTYCKYVSKKRLIVVMWLEQMLLNILQIKDLRKLLKLFLLDKQITYTAMTNS